MLKFFPQKIQNFVVTNFFLKNRFSEHFRHKSLFVDLFRKSLGTFQKWTKINVQNGKPNLLFEKNMLLKIQPIYCLYFCYYFTSQIYNNS